MSGIVGAVFLKELLDSLRDRRSLLAALIMPVMGPGMFALMFSLLVEKHSPDKPVELAVAGRERAPSLMGFLEQRDVTLKDAPEDPDAAVREGDVHCVLVIPEEYPERFREGRPARLELILDESNDDASSTVHRVRGLLGEYGRNLAGLRLLARGVSPGLVAAVYVDEVDLATPQREAARLLGMIPMFALLAAFMGGMNVAIDATAGERERRSLEPLLITPAPRIGIVLGKWLAAVLHALVVLALTLAMFRLALDHVPLEQIGFTVELGLERLWLLFGVVAPVAPFSAALLMAVSIFARTFKEAQTYLSVLVFLPMLPGFVLMVNPMTPQTWMMVIPTFAQNALVVELLRGEPVTSAHVWLSSAATAVAAALILVVTARLFGRERIVFGR